MLFYTFNQKTTFNADLSKWNTERVTSLDNTFAGCSLFNSDISKWDTSNLFSLAGTFRGASVFNSDLSNWDVSKTYPYEVFQDCSALNQTFCGNTWIDLPADKRENMFTTTNGASIGTIPCSCNQGNFYQTTSPPSCQPCPASTSQLQNGFTGSKCEINVCITKGRSTWKAVGCVATNPAADTVEGLGNVTAADGYVSCVITCPQTGGPFQVAAYSIYAASPSSSTDEYDEDDFIFDDSLNLGFTSAKVTVTSIAIIMYAVVALVI